MKERTLNNLPTSNYLWKGLGGNFDSFTQIINEFIDNSISNLQVNNYLDLKNIWIKILEEEGSKYKVIVEDTGTGLENLDAAFTIGADEGQYTSLNEHGFGMKHALAAANKTNDNWSVETKNIKNSDLHYLIEAPYDVSNQIVQEIKGEWKGHTDTGTIIKFTVDKHWIKTISTGLRGSYTKLDTLMEILAEDLGYYYSDYIKNDGINIMIKYKAYSNNDFENIIVSSVEPNVDQSINPGIGETMLDLGNGEVKLKYQFLSAIDSQYRKHYKANMSTSGIEIRVNGRLLADNLFSQVWMKEKHNSYNHILIKLNIISNDKNKLPTTTTNKTGFKQDDPKLQAIYKWIRSKMTEPKPKAYLSNHEIDLFNQLKSIKEKVLASHDSSLVLEQEMRAFQSIGENIKIDLYESFLNTICIYEGKKDKTTPQDVYQLLMYWDGLAMDGIEVDKGILIASRHPDSVKSIVEEKNKNTDPNGRMYNIEMRTWQDESVNYPN